MKIKPMGDRVLIKVEDGDKTTSGLYLPENRLKDRPSEGVVEAVGKTKHVKVGDRVIFVQHGQVDIKGEDKIIIEESDILAIVTK